MGKGSWGLSRLVGLSPRPLTPSPTRGEGELAKVLLLRGEGDTFLWLLSFRRFWE